jgi:truncated hemoglobin YjbI
LYLYLIGLRHVATALYRVRGLVDHYGWRGIPPSALTQSFNIHMFYLLYGRPRSSAWSAWRHYSIAKAPDRKSAMTVMKSDSITEQSVDALVERFYAKVRCDAVLAPIFESALAGRWDEHVATMREFWYSALRVRRDYRGDMLAAHQRLGRLPRSLFPRWLALFRETVDENFSEAPAKAIQGRALKTARNLESALTHGGSALRGPTTCLASTQ